jgi:hypothetical protein
MSLEVLESFPDYADWLAARELQTASQAAVELSPSYLGTLSALQTAVISLLQQTAPLGCPGAIIVLISLHIAYLIQPGQEIH